MTTTRTADEIYAEIVELHPALDLALGAPLPLRLAYWEAEVIRQRRRVALWSELTDALVDDRSAPAWGLSATMGAASDALEQAVRAEGFVRGLRDQLAAASR